MPNLTRRTLLQATAGIAVAAVAPRIVLAQTTPPAAGPFRQDPLPYAANALEPAVDARTMEIHHGKHHAAYVNNLNKALEGQTQLQSLSLDALLAGLDKVPENIRTAVRNNGGGHSNHSMFWKMMLAMASSVGLPPYAPGTVTALGTVRWKFLLARTVPPLALRGGA